jgi:hypothetical protein
MGWVEFGYALRIVKKATKLRMLGKREFLTCFYDYEYMRIARKEISFASGRSIRTFVIAHRGKIQRFWESIFHREQLPYEVLRQLKAIPSQFSSATLLDESL